MRAPKPGLFQRRLRCRCEIVGQFVISAVDGLEEPESRARALYEFAQFLSQRGVPLIDAGVHSDNRRDVMYPTNTASRLSSGDFATMRGLYELPNGALIELPRR